MMREIIQNLVFVAGIAHFGLCIGSVLVPEALRWKQNLMVLPGLLRQMFWTYAVYILNINFGFGFISVVATEELLSHSILAKCLTLFIAIYWLGRILVQFFYFDRTDAPKGFVYTLGEIALVTLFVLFTFVYAVAFCFNYRWI
jgi:hypothetical protein